MTTFAAILAAIASLLGIVWMKGRSDKKAGNLEAKHEQAEKQLEDIDKAVNARNRLDSDPEHYNRVRDKYTRKDE